MRKPCTDCPHFYHKHIKPTFSCAGVCMAGRLDGWPNIPVPWGYYEKIANCVDYAEYLAWQRERRKKRNERQI